MPAAYLQCLYCCYQEHDHARSHVCWLLLEEDKLQP